MPLSNREQVQESDGRESIEIVAAQMADTLRAALMVASSPEPYPWQGGALKNQIREDLTAFEALGLDLEIPRRVSDEITDEMIERARAELTERGARRCSAYVMRQVLRAALEGVR